MSTFVENIQFVTETCCSCGMPFAMTADFQQRRRRDRETFHCPAGHPQHYTGKTEEQKVREELERTRSNLEAEKSRALALADQRDQIARAHKRMRDRVKNGVCPCCKRTFENMLKHMRTEHPEFTEEKSLRVLREAYGLTQSALAGEVGIQSAYVSMHENGRPVPAHAKRRIDAWIERQAA